MGKKAENCFWNFAKFTKGTGKIRMNNHSGEWKDIKRGLILCIGILKSIFFERILPAEN